MSKEMARKLSIIDAGDIFYDIANAREIRVDQIYNREHTAACTVFEYNEHGDIGKEYYQMFGLEELLRLDLKEG